jgi:nucleotide-binding universal stress UspA family protein
VEIEPIPPVVVGLDGSAASLAAVDLAAEEAAGRVTPLEILYVFEQQPVSCGASPEERAALLTEAGQTLAVAMGRVRADHPGLAVRGVFLLGDPVPAVVRHVAGACLAVVGHHGRAGTGPVGPVAAQVAARASVPVIVTRPFDREHAVPSPRPVLLGVDGLPGSEPAVAFAFAEAALRGAPMRVHHLWRARPGAGEPAGVVGGAEFAEARQQALRALSDLLAAWSVKHPEVQLGPVQADTGETLAALLAATHDAQLVVVGTPAHAESPDPLAGKVGCALIERSGCSVAVTPAR